MEFNLADMFENAVDHFADREYLVCDGKRRTYREMEERANRLAHHLQAHGIGAGDHVGVYALNGVFAVMAGATLNGSGDRAAGRSAWLSAASAMAAWAVMAALAMFIDRVSISAC